MSVANRREREREQRRSWILDAAERCFHAKGIDAVKMEDVAEEAQLGKGTLYLYFRTKEALLLAVAVRHQRHLLGVFDAEARRAQDGISLLRALLLAYARHMMHPAEHLKLAMARWVNGPPVDIESRGGAQLRENVNRIFTMVCDAIRRGQEDGSVTPDVDPPRAAMTLWAAVNGALLMTLQLSCLPRNLPMRESAPTVEAAVDFHLRAVANQAAPQPRLVAGGGA